jgi:hypothetical protein
MTEKTTKIDDSLLKKAQTEMVCIVIEQQLH